MMQPNRAKPVADPRAYQTYQILAPRQTHTRAATCREVECEHWQHGWVTRVDVSTDLGQRQAAYIVEKSGRHFSETTGLNSALREFNFPPGQRCFREHRVSLERPAVYRKLDGDWRGNPTGRVQLIPRAEDWRDDMGETLEKIRDEREKG